MAMLALAVIPLARVMHCSYRTGRMLRLGTVGEILVLWCVSPGDI
jgi:hypothetical protein